MLDGKGLMTSHINLAYGMKSRIDLGNCCLYKKQKTNFIQKKIKKITLVIVLYFDRHFIAPNLFVPTGDVNLLKKRATNTCCLLKEKKKKQSNFLKQLSKHGVCWALFSVADLVPY